jgi:hypothetical protein
MARSLQRLRPRCHLRRLGIKTVGGQFSRERRICPGFGVSPDNGKLAASWACRVCSAKCSSSTCCRG